ncbi:hypothetical protein KVR01_012957 [Diaporthe batatas]|uniref:uncharacterized protein n=1 Tax=Diaporthe batatas TaxID=748121 RepID=UPI001D0380DF|nr:uncharacterized protein KVR01_012957 [Diaporthe batatas]KAG8157249.1 hypothetical protein KVR01_012957 [Diaporthe batatas]
MLLSLPAFMAVFASVVASVSASSITLKLHSRAPDTAGVDVPVTDWFSRTDNQWYTTFSIGTPPQELTALLDTGTNLLFLPRSNCTTCPNLTLFDPDKSNTFSGLPGVEATFPFVIGADSIPLLRPEEVTCKSVHDTVSLGYGKLKVDGQHFALCDKYLGFPDQPARSPISGIMGMGIRNPFTNETPWFWNLFEDDQLESPLFSLYTPPHDLAGGQVTLGGVDESKVEGNISWTSLNAVASRDLFSYVIDLSNIYANGRILSGNLSDLSPASAPFSYAILDTAVPFIQTPRHIVSKSIYAHISPNITQIDHTGAWGAPCDQIASMAPELTFTLGTGAQALNLTIPKEYFNLGEFLGLPGTCQTLFNSPTRHSQLRYNATGLWVVGSPLLDKYYTVWDGLDLRMGWGKLPGMPGFGGHSG